MINVILACTKDDWGIGYKNGLPWNIPEELKLFQEITKNSALIMGRKSIEHLPLLKNRQIYCLSRKLHESHSVKVKIGNNHVYVYRDSFELVKDIRKTKKQIYVAGGGQIYDYFLMKNKTEISKIFLSVVDEKCQFDTTIDWRPSFKNFILEKRQVYPKFTHYVMNTTYHLGVNCMEKSYLSLLSSVYYNGQRKKGRNGFTKSLFGKTLEFDLSKGFPLLTTKRMFFRGVVEELLFFIRGDTDTTLLQEKKINIWKGNTNRAFLDSIGKTDRKEGMMGPMYGWSWRNFNAQYNELTGKPNFYSTERDQLLKVVKQIRNEPNSRRILLTTYNPLQAEEGVLYPCHSIVNQFYVREGYLDMFCYNRSSDLFHGLPFNIASSSLFLILIAIITGLKPGKFILSLGDCHIYESHETAVLEQLNRVPFKFPDIKVNKTLKSLSDIEKLMYDDFELINYKYYPSIKAKMVA